jgi:hypothetical protein
MIPLASVRPQNGLPQKSAERGETMTTPKTSVVLDRALSASQARTSAEVKRILTGILKEATVQVTEKYFYQVDFGTGVQPQRHVVSYDLICTCALDEDCPAVTAVKHYLQKEKGEKAERPRPGYFPVIPHSCPICGARVYYDPRLTSKNRGLGWRCRKGGASCYWKNQAAALQRAYSEKWMKLGIDPAGFAKHPAFAFREGYDPEWVPPTPFSGCNLAHL